MHQWEKSKDSFEWLPYTTMRIREVGIRILGNDRNDNPCEFGIKNI